MTAVAQVSDLNCHLGGRALLRGVSLGLRAGELLAVLGPNGAGKSTLIRHLTGELQAQGVRLFGLDPARHDRRALARRRATLAQRTDISFSHEVLDVVLLGRIPHGGRETAHDRAVAMACLAEVGLSELAARDITTLSGGEQQRVHLARVLAQLHDTAGERLLLLDEPTAALDLAHQHATLRTARRLTEDGVGVLAVLHDLNLAAQYADRLLLLCGGEVLACGTPAEVLTAEHIRCAYGHPVLVTPHPCLGCPLVVSAE